MNGQTSKNKTLFKIVLLGGSFNPPHYGHMRLAVEVFEAIKPCRLDFIPCANPPHKSGRGLLPFALRHAMLEAACKGSSFYISGLEAERSGPSYTSDTLDSYHVAHPEAELFFVLGAEDFASIDTWHEWQQLPCKANLLVVARQGVGEADFFANTSRLWPGAVPCAGVGAGSKAMQVQVNGAAGAQTGRILYLSLPRLDISASLLRSRWMQGRSISYWINDDVISLLEENREIALNHWQE